jgi:HPt (histidine-containing phosphotransfer) domain-containing protein
VLDPHLMIVALTANASGEDRARYLACGMDAFLTKPIDDVQLHFHLSRAIERQLQRGVELQPMVPPAIRDAAGRPSTADLDAMFGVVTEAQGGTPAEQPDGASATAPSSPGYAPKFGRRAGDLKGKMRAAFAADLPRRRSELDAALAAGDFEACGRLLHGMRGSAGYLGEAELHQLCTELEREADNGRLDQVRARLPKLLGLLARFDETTA